MDGPGPRPGEVTARPGLDGRVTVSRGQRGAPGQAGAGVGRLPGSQCGSLPPGHHLCPGRARPQVGSPQQRDSWGPWRGLEA